MVCLCLPSLECKHHKSRNLFYALNDPPKPRMELALQGTTVEGGRNGNQEFWVQIQHGNEARTEQKSSRDLSWVQVKPDWPNLHRTGSHII